MKFLLFGLLALLCVSQLAAAQQGRTYTNEVEYVDRLDISPQATELPVAAAPAAAKVEPQESSLMESASAAAEERPMEFFMENEAGVEDVWRELSSFAEVDSASEVDTEVVRAMALEIHDAAQAALDDAESGMVLALVEAEAEAEMQAEAEAERKEALSPAELAQEKADEAAEQADRLAEQKDAAEAAADRTEAKRDQKILKKVASPAVAPKKQQQKKAAVSKAAAMSKSHAHTLRQQLAATRTVRGALGELNAILSSKDEAIRSLVHNVTYLTVNTGKLANKVDSQRAYIRALEKQLAAARQKNLAMHRHVAQSHATAQSIRAQLAAVEKRLDTQDRATSQLSDFISRKNRAQRRSRKHGKKSKGRKHSKKSRRDRFRRRVMKLRPVDGTQTFATGQVPFPHYRVSQPTFGSTPAAAPRTVASGYYSRSAAVAAPGVQPVPAPYGNIPTIIVEAADDGQ